MPSEVSQTEKKKYHMVSLILKTKKQMHIYRKQTGCCQKWGVQGGQMSEGGFPGGSEVKVSASNAGDLGSIPGWGRPPGEENGNPLQYSCLENPMDGGAWWATVHGVANE